MDSTQLKFPLVDISKKVDENSIFNDENLSPSEKLNKYKTLTTVQPLFIQGDALSVLKDLPDSSVDCCITSPPYWLKREYKNSSTLGLEKNVNEFLDNLLEIFKEVKRVLKPTGSFWLNIGDSYKNKELQLLPWRLAIKMIDEQGWILRNNVIWNKVKGGMDNSKDKLGNVHEPIFHFVKQKKYYYDVNKIRNKPRDAKIESNRVVSATGVSGVSYRRKIELSTVLTDEQKKNAFEALDKVLDEIREGLISDFRMQIKGATRTTHSDSTKLSGRAKEIDKNGFCVLKYHKDGSKPSDVWDIIPEDSQTRNNHSAPYPEDLCKIPILATCPSDGIVLDPFAGSGTTSYVAMNFKRKSIGIDVSDDYIKIAKERCKNDESI